MVRFKKRIFIGITIVQLLLLSNMLSGCNGLPIITSRVSEVSEITVITDPYNKPISTLFGIGVIVGILNRAEKHQTVVELSDFYPKVFINATLSNQTLVIDPLMFAHATIMRFSYVPGITVEYSYVKFYINQLGLSQAPDGNYTLWRPINTAYIINNISSEELLTKITMNTGVMNITYTNFTNCIPTKPYTEESSSSIVVPIISLIIFAIIISHSGCRRFKSCLSHQF